MNMKWMWMLSGGLLLGGVGSVGAWWVTSRESSSKIIEATSQIAMPQTPVALAAPSVATPTPPVARESECVFSVEQEIAYALTIKTEATVNSPMLGMASQGTVPPLVNYSSLRLALKPLAVNKKHAVLVGKFEIRADNQTSFSQDFKSPFLIRISHDCSIAGFAYFEKTSQYTARVQQSLLHELMWRWPAQREPMTGENGVGVWNGVMALSSDATRIQRRIHHYSKIWDSNQEHVVPEDSLATVIPGEGPWFASLSNEEILKTDHVQTQTQLHAQSMRASPDALRDVPHEIALYRWDNLLPRKITHREPRPVTALDVRAREAVKHQTPTQAIDAYVARVKKGVGIADTWPPLTAYLEVHPEATQDVVKFIKIGDAPPEALQNMYIALGRARTPEAKEALFSIKRDSQAPVFERTRAMFALIDRDDVDVSLAKELGQDAMALVLAPTPGSRTLAAEALLALSTMAGLRDESDVKSEAVSMIRMLLSDNQHARTLSPVFGAIANVGDPALLPLISKHTASPDVKIRAAAAVVFRRMPPEKSMDTVIAWLQRENSPRVKREIYRIVEMQLFDAKIPTPPALVEQTIRDFNATAEPIHRKASVRLLGRAVGENPVIRKLFQAEARRAIRENTGLYDTIAHYLRPGEIREIFASRSLEPAPNLRPHAIMPVVNSQGGSVSP